MIKNRLAGFVCVSAVALTTHAASAAAEFYDLVEPTGWTVGSSLSTYQDWAKDTSTGQTLAGSPKVGYDSAGAGLPASTLSPVAPGYEATIGFYSFMGHYGFTANLQGHEPASPPAGTGTHVIVQTYAGVNDDPAYAAAFPNGSVANVALSAPGAIHLSSTTYGQQDRYVAFFDDILPFQATIDEFWIPNFTGDFTVTGGIIAHSSFTELRVDTKIATEATGGGTPYSITPVPEPTGALAVALGVVGPMLAMRRRRHRVIASA